ncbi:MAG TPA: hypothetical protein VIQ30_20090 [Pseudonocardia sp.]
MTVTRTNRRTVRATSPVLPVDPTVCRCRRTEGGTRTDYGAIVGARLVPGGRPQLYARFVDQTLVEVRRIHFNDRDGCPIPTEHIAPADYQRDVL